MYDHRIRRIRRIFLTRGLRLAAKRGHGNESHSHFQVLSACDTQLTRQLTFTKGGNDRRGRHGAKRTQFTSRQANVI
jgi:hypothetical protein